jgi:hypothetical protein
MDNSEYKYIENSEAGVVVCLMKRQDFIDEVSYYALNKLARIVWNSKAIQHFDSKKIFTDAISNFLDAEVPQGDVRTIARCNFEAGDTFDSDVGRIIASRRMDLQIAEIALGLLDSIYEDFDFFLDEVGKRGRNIERYCNALQKDILELAE